MTLCCALCVSKQYFYLQKDLLSRRAHDRGLTLDGGYFVHWQLTRLKPVEALSMTVLI